MSETPGENTGPEGNQKNDEPEEKIWPHEWMLRPCDMYYSEYRVCNSIRGKFNQIFVEGEVADCTQWKVDYEKCIQWKKSGDQQSYEDLVASEKVRRLNRLKGHYANDVWTKRQAPPEDWDAPLPDWLAKRDAKTFLAGKQNEINTTGDKEFELYIPSCTIL
ncbi:UPF0545 protein C22orf39 homolog [Fopius arisanus]|uniref:Synaptic plasticity regulator PANTS n=1 Tax=Fopius arisanus TaxID=64838 RepID=A0A9R1U682_9HYME|nr:PREDICTED: UPF0545 protein C22orf39 homolog [Fopius arisanus]